MALPNRRKPPKQSGKSTKDPKHQALLDALLRCGKLLTLALEPKPGSSIQSILSAPLSALPFPIPYLSKKEKEHARQKVRPVVAGAELDADLVGKYIETLVDDLLFLNCQPADVERFLRNRQRTLASLHLLIQNTPHPSPDEMRRLALRFALDPQKPIEEPLHLFKYQRVGAGGQIAQYPMGPQIYPCRVWSVKDPRTIKILDLVYASLAGTSGLMPLIESILGRRPNAGDALSSETFARFTFEICPQPKSWPVARLWIDDQEVPLKKWKGIHRLLASLCTHPETSGTSKEIGKSLGISNVGQVTTAIKNALGETHPGAKVWLETGPLRWADGRNPLPH